MAQAVEAAKGAATGSVRRKVVNEKLTSLARQRKRTAWAASKYYRRREKSIKIIGDTSRRAGWSLHRFMRLLGKGYVDESALEQLISDLESGTHMAAGQA